MIRIKIFCPFSTSKNSKDVYERINYANENSFYGENKIYNFVNDNEEYTHAIIINTIMPKLEIPKENVIGLAFEPIFFLELTPEFIDYAKKYIGKYYIGDKFDLPDPFTEHFGYMWHSRPPKELTTKPKLMSIIVSEKTFAPGHVYRHKLVQTIINNNLPIDIYGRGSEKYAANGKRIMGTFNHAEPYEEYMFSICIENYVCNHYFSEKIMTPLMYNCMPIYYGCKNIGSYIENTINLTGDILFDINLIVNILKYPEVYYKKTYTTKNIKAVNLIENLPNIFTS
jgi:hypothetical protein